jgi:hydrogenase/urease accessory protein HupE
VLRRSLLLVAAGTPQLALAHSPIEGIGHFYGGLLHPLMVLSHALALLLFALLVGQRGLRAMRFAYPPFLFALATGLVLAAFALPLGINSELILMCLAMTCGLLVVLQWSPPAVAFTLLGAAVGLVIGADTAMPGLSPRQTFAAMLGCWVGALLLLVVVAGLVELLRRPWQRIAVRVMASWGAACALLVLALAWRG